MEYELYHHGVKGQKWGVRRYQNKDGSLTPAGKKRRSRYDRAVEKTARGISRAGVTAERYKSDSRETKAAQTALFGGTNRQLSAEGYLKKKESSKMFFDDVKTSKYAKDGKDYFKTVIESKGKTYVSEMLIGDSKKNLHSSTEEGRINREVEKRYREKAASTKSKRKKKRYESRADRSRKIADAYDVK